jgi:hypothetical protein
MTIFVSVMLVLFILWFAVGLIAIYAVLTEEAVTRTLKGIRDGKYYTGELKPFSVTIHVVVPFIGAAACAGYLFG